MAYNGEDMKWRDEAGMQTDFSPWSVSGAGLDWIAGMNPASVGNIAAAFELKHVRCEGRKGKRAACTPTRCAGRLAVGEHEEMQADALRYAAGRGTNRGAKGHKISDMSAGYKPFDCFVLGRGTLARFVIGWSCGLSRGARVYAVGFERMEEWRALGVASVTEEMAIKAGERLRAFDGGE